MPVDYSKLREVCPLLDDFDAKRLQFRYALQARPWDQSRVDRTGENLGNAEVKYRRAAAAAQPELQQSRVHHFEEIDRARQARDFDKVEAATRAAIEASRAIDENARAFCNTPSM